MDPLGISQPIILPKQTVSVNTGSDVPAIPAHSSQPMLPIGGGSGFDAQAAEQKRVEAVRRLSQDIANVYVVSDMKFTIFKDASGQYITRFTSLRDGKVTYIPEPTLFKSGGSSTASLLSIEA